MALRRPALDPELRSLLATMPLRIGLDVETHGEPRDDFTTLYQWTRS